MEEKNEAASAVAAAAAAAKMSAVEVVPPVTIDSPSVIPPVTVPSPVPVTIARPVVPVTVPTAVATAVVPTTMAASAFDDDEEPPIITAPTITVPSLATESTAMDVDKSQLSDSEEDDTRPIAATAEEKGDLIPKMKPSQLKRTPSRQVSTPTGPSEETVRTLINQFKKTCLDKNVSFKIRINNIRKYMLNRGEQLSRAVVLRFLQQLRGDETLRIWLSQATAKLSVTTTDEFERKQAEKLISVILDLLEHCKRKLRISFTWRGSLLDGIRFVSRHSRVDPKLKKHANLVRDLLLDNTPSISVNSPSGKMGFRSSQSQHGGFLNRQSSHPQPRYSYTAHQQSPSTPQSSNISSPNKRGSGFDAFDPAADMPVTEKKSMPPPQQQQSQQQQQSSMITRQVLIPTDGHFMNVDWHLTVLGPKGVKQKELEDNHNVQISLCGDDSHVPLMTGQTPRKVLIKGSNTSDVEAANFAISRIVFDPRHHITATPNAPPPPNAPSSSHVVNLAEPQFTSPYSGGGPSAMDNDRDARYSRDRRGWREFDNRHPSNDRYQYRGPGGSMMDRDRPTPQPLGSGPPMINRRRFGEKEPPSFQQRSGPPLHPHLHSSQQHPPTMGPPPQRMAGVTGPTSPAPANRGKYAHYGDRQQQAVVISSSASPPMKGHESVASSSVGLQRDWTTSDGAPTYGGSASPASPAPPSSFGSGSEEPLPPPQEDMATTTPMDPNLARRKTGIPVVTSGAITANAGGSGGAGNSGGGIGRVSSGNSPWLRVAHKNDKTEEVEFYYWNQETNETDWDEPKQGWVDYHSDLPLDTETSTTELDISDMEIRSSEVTTSSGNASGSGTDVGTHAYSNGRSSKGRSIRLTDAKVTDALRVAELSLGGDAGKDVTMKDITKPQQSSQPQTNKSNTSASDAQSRLNKLSQGIKPTTSENLDSSLMELQYLAQVSLEAAGVDSSESAGLISDMDSVARATNNNKGTTHQKSGAVGMDDIFANLTNRDAPPVTNVATPVTTTVTVAAPTQISYDPTSAPVPNAQTGGKPGLVQPSLVLTSLMQPGMNQSMVPIIAGHPTRTFSSGTTTPARTTTTTTTSTSLSANKAMSTSVPGSVPTAAASTPVSPATPTGVVVTGGTPTKDISRQSSPRKSGIRGRSRSDRRSSRSERDRMRSRSREWSRGRSRDRSRGRRRPFSRDRSRERYDRDGRRLSHEGRRHRRDRDLWRDRDRDRDYWHNRDRYRERDSRHRDRDRRRGSRGSGGRRYRKSGDLSGDSSFYTGSDSSSLGSRSSSSSRGRSFDSSSDDRSSTQRRRSKPRRAPILSPTKAVTSAAVSTSNVPLSTATTAVVSQPNKQSQSSSIPILAAAATATATVARVSGAASIGAKQASTMAPASNNAMSTNIDPKSL